MVVSADPFKSLIDWADRHAIIAMGRTETR